jgi:hypothetical protein
MFYKIKFSCFFVLLVSFIFTIEINAQSEIITIKNSLLRLPDQQFYLAGIIDGRENKADIGFITKGAFNKHVSAKFNSSLEDAFSSYFNFALNKDSTKSAIVMKVLNFKISEIEDGAEEVGKAELEVAFYKSEKDKLAKVFQTEALAEEKGNDIGFSHERRIRKVLENVLMGFNNSNWQEVELNYEPASIVKSVVSLEKNSDLKNTKKWISLLTGHGAFGTNAEGWGLSYYGYRTKESGGWFLNYSISFDKYSIDPGLVIRKGYSKINLNYGKIGIGLMRRLGEDFHFSFNALVPIGYENLTQSLSNQSSLETGRFIIGLEPQQCFYFITKSKVGLILGAGIFERFISSKVYNFDVGLRIEAGIKF